jgi:hypothetical protein
MMACAHCKLNYPDELLNPIFLGGAGVKEGYTAPVCGICALEISNAFHGAARKRFDGQLAEESRQRAIEWRRKQVWK